ncbi:MAG: hypothetical protein WBS33_11150 [Verrucomicrobiia bacterium]
MYHAASRIFAARSGRLASVKGSVLRSGSRFPAFADGMSYGQRVQREQPEIVRRIFAEYKGEHLESSLSVVQEVVAEAGGIDAVRLLPALKRWQKSVYDEDEPRCYGEAVERVALFSDFAVWIPWGLSQPLVKPEPKKDSGATGQPAQIEL